MRSVIIPFSRYVPFISFKASSFSYIQILLFFLFLIQECCIISGVSGMHLEKNVSVIRSMAAISANAVI